MNMFYFFDKVFPLLFVSVFSITIILMIRSFALAFSPKARARWYAKNIRAQKMAIDDVKEELKDLAETGAEISSEPIRKTVKAIKEGLSDGESPKDDPYKLPYYCRYCGKEIDKDSRFCKHCGKEQ